jgi:ABC-2 type transport system permease protein
MKTLFAFFKKEVQESLRGARVIALALIFVAFGFMNPALTLITPWVFDLLAEELGEMGDMLAGAITADALTSWAQFFKNIPMALIAFVFFYSNTFTREYRTGTLILVLTKGLARYKVLLAKTANMLIVWTLGYWLCFGITYGCNAILWDNRSVESLFFAGFNWWLFGILTIALIVLFSVVFKSYVGVLMGTGGVIFAFSVIGFIPKIAKFLPTSLMNSTSLMVGTDSPEDYLWTVIISAVLSVACIIASVPIFNKKEI